METKTRHLEELIYFHQILELNQNGLQMFLPWPDQAASWKIKVYNPSATPVAYQDSWYWFTVGCRHKAAGEQGCNIRLPIHQRRVNGLKYSESWFSLILGNDLLDTLLWGQREVKITSFSALPWIQTSKISEYLFFKYNITFYTLSCKVSTNKLKYF